MIFLPVAFVDGLVLRVDVSTFTICSVVSVPALVNWTVDHNIFTFTLSGIWQEKQLAAVIGTIVKQFVFYNKLAIHDAILLYVIRLFSVVEFI